MTSRDVQVIGGGPAGATAALLLAAWGHSVTLHTKSPGEHRLAVSVPPSCAKLFDAIGVADAIERADFVRSTGNTVWWGHRDARIEHFATGRHGWQLEIHELSKLLIHRARNTGARITESPQLASPAAIVLDCSGRSGVLARAKRLREFDGPRTVALVGEWKCEGSWAVPDDTHTLIESYEAGWVWSVPTRRGTRHIAAMVDPQRSDLQRGGSSLATYQAELRKTRVFQRLLESASLESGPWGWDASPYHARDYAGDGWLLVGDAGSFIDPLSSAGVKKALASAWLAAIVVNTCLTTPHAVAAAREFFSAREREIHRDLSRDGQRFAASAAGDYLHPFWDERATEEELPAGADGVRQAFERLKRLDSLHVRRGETLRIEPRPCVRGNLIVLEPHLVTDHDTAVRYVRGIDVLTLVILAPGQQSVPGLYEALVGQCGPAPLDDFLFALATAVSRRWIVSE